MATTKRKKAPKAHHPSPDLVKSTRLKLGLSTEECAQILQLKNRRSWQYYETGERNMRPLLWEHFLATAKKKKQAA